MQSTHPHSRLSLEQADAAPDAVIHVRPTSLLLTLIALPLIGVACLTWARVRDAFLLRDVESLAATGLTILGISVLHGCVLAFTLRNHLAMLFSGKARAKLLLPHLVASQDSPTAQKQRPVSQRSARSEGTWNHRQQPGATRRSLEWSTSKRHMHRGDAPRQVSARENLAPVLTLPRRLPLAA